MLSNLTAEPQVTPPAVPDQGTCDVSQIYILSCCVLSTKTKGLPLCNPHQRHFSKSPQCALSLALAHIVVVFENSLWLNSKSQNMCVLSVLQNSYINTISFDSSIVDSKYLTLYGVPET
jgi:hypothetical protein